MKIIKLDIIEFGGLTDRHFELCEGLNIFCGDNETGKSTVWAFVKFMLYGLPNKKGHPDRIRGINRSTHRAYGTMTVLWGGELYIIERSLSENSKDRTVLYKVGGEKVDLGGKEVGEYMLGVPKDVFENSCGIGQASCSGLGGDKGAAAIKNMLTSADESVDVERILRQLDKIRVEYRHKVGKGGRLYELSEKINDASRRLDRATERHLAIVDIEEKLERNTSLLKENEEALAKFGGILSKLQTVEVLRRFDGLAENEKKLAEYEAERDGFLTSELENGYEPCPMDIADLSMTADRAKRAEEAQLAAEKRFSAYGAQIAYDEELAKVGEDIENDGGIEPVTEKIKKISNLKKIALYLTVPSVVLVMVGGGGISILGPVAIALLAIGAVGVIAGACLIASALSSGKRLGAKYGKSYKELEAYLKKCVQAFKDKRLFEMSHAQLKAELDLATAQREEVFISLEKALRRSSDIAEITPEGARAEGVRLKNILTRYEELKARCVRLSHIIENDRNILSVYDEKALRENACSEVTSLESLSIGDIESKVRLYSEKVRTLREREESLRTELINHRAVSEDPALLSDALEGMKVERQRGESYYESLVLAMDGITKASEALRGSVTPLIGTNASRIIEYVSDGKYASVNISSNMEPSLVDKNGLLTTGDMMSGGMRDTAYLALRLSLMKQLYGSETPPIMMDETLCQLDDGRMKRMIGLLGRLCDNGEQCLLFTCHEREQRACSELGVDALTHRL